MDHLLNLKKENNSPIPSFRRAPRKYLLAAGLVLVLAAGLWCLFSPRPYRAVFLTNDQVYFGKFRSHPFASTISLRDIYYLQVSQTIQPSSGDVSPQEMKIVKLGSELHGPEDKMVIPKTQILFYEDLRADSLVVKTIEEFKSRQ